MPAGSAGAAGHRGGGIPVEHHGVVRIAEDAEERRRHVELAEELQRRLVESGRKAKGK